MFILLAKSLHSLLAAHRNPVQFFIHMLLFYSSGDGSKDFAFEATSLPLGCIFSPNHSFNLRDYTRGWTDSGKLSGRKKNPLEISPCRQHELSAPGLPQDAILNHFNNCTSKPLKICFFLVSIHYVWTSFEGDC